MNKNNFCIIMAGGIGTRFWPMSTSKQPKQFHDVLGCGKTLIQATYDRLLKVAPVDQIYVITNQDYAALTLEQLPGLSANQLVTEPLAMNTAACNMYVAAKIHQLNPNAKMLIAPSDHLILDETEFVKKAFQALDYCTNDDILITLGIEPSRPDTGYGYIQYQKESKSDLKKVELFTEKPNFENAAKYMDSGDFLWNSGIFIWSSQSILNAFNQHLPSMYKAFFGLNTFYNTSNETEEINKLYPTVEKDSIDYAIMEKAKNVYVIPSSFGWSDLGTWMSLYENQPKDENKNVIYGKATHLYDSTENIVKTCQEKSVIIKGLKGYIVVDTAEALLICPKENDQEIKNFVSNLRF